MLSSPACLFALLMGNYLSCRVQGWNAPWISQGYWNKTEKCAIQFSSVKYSGVSKLTTSTSSSPGLGAVSASETLAPSSPGLRTISGCQLGGQSSGAPCSSKAVGVGVGRDRSLFVFVHKNSQKSLSWVVSVTSFFKCQDLAFLWLSLPEFHSIVVPYQKSCLFL